MSAHKTLRISVLDQAPIAANRTGGQALRQVIDLARLAERSGFHRYWIAEHHATPGLASASPEVLLGAVGMATARIRIGTGGVMLPHYSPFKVAETFSMLAGLFPDRVDLGLGRAPGSDGRTAYALQRDRRERAPDDFPQVLAELLGYLDDRIPESHPFAYLSKTLPGGTDKPAPWMLGTSPDSAAWAAELGLPYCIADFINPHGAELAEQYRQAFRPNPDRGITAPQVMVASWSITADTVAEAERLALSSRMLFKLLHRGELIAVPSPEEARRFLESDTAPNTRRRRLVLGTPDLVRAGLEAIAAEYGAEEVMVVNIMYEHDARLRSYALLAEAFGLPEQLQN
ncbi:LLM class flavin-dependent oxidoreductase [Acidisoma cellulosilytica]|uniref:Luciferase-like monooxygenase n=1 Tax=Acidisoma cellulosilyticum TaxID=2802395 RepID=A0A963Z0E3_9PROT|nr:LLM class flavin-dependent oxidoreductase [Acidisoma cellulosilyticum]MCB8880483.1 LLM class flavin-dependent oxidoreductase [Acidisoma cellulosilyticum]